MQLKAYLMEQKPVNVEVYWSRNVASETTVEAFINTKERKMTALLSTLKLSNAKKPKSVSDVTKRRNKLIKKLSEQRELAVAHADGKTFAATRLRTVKDAETGLRVAKETAVRIKQWWWEGDKGETLFAVHYGSKLLDLSKGKATIEVANIAELIKVLDVLTSAVKSGELDTQMEAASAKLRDGFKG